MQIILKTCTYFSFSHILVASDLDVLNEGIPGSSTRRNKLQKVPQDMFFAEVEGIIGSMQRAITVQGMDGAAASYKVAKIKLNFFKK